MCYTLLRLEILMTKIKFTESRQRRRGGQTADGGGTHAIVPHICSLHACSGLAPSAAASRRAAEVEALAQHATRETKIVFTMGCFSDYVYSIRCQ